MLSSTQEVCDNIFSIVKRGRENIILTGMPASGKSTVGKLLADSMERDFFDTDAIIEENEGMSIPDIFKKYGEEYFRDAERRAISVIAKSTSAVISTGGGAILSKENVSALKQNGRIYFIDRPPEKLIPTSDRPLAKDREDIMKRYNERYEIYLSTCDVRIDADRAPREVLNMIKEDFENEDICN